MKICYMYKKNKFTLLKDKFIFINSIEYRISLKMGLFDRLELISQTNHK